MSYQTGFNGKVGLVLGPALAKKKTQQLAPVRKAPSGVAGLFGGTGAADEADASQSAPQAVNLEVLRHQAQAAKMAAAATEVVDESVYDYDSFVDQEEERKRARAAAAAAVAAAQPQRGGPQRKESRYIGSLLKQAEERELERERIYERKLVKERKKEDELFGDKPLFVTEGYKRKLEEQRKRDEEEKRREALNVDVTKKADLTGFYSHMLDELAGEPSDAPAVPTVHPDKLLPGPTVPTTARAESSVPPSSVKAPAAVTEPVSDAQPSTSASGDITPASIAPAPAAAPVLSKAELIAQAKERALARKRARDTGAPEPGDA